MGQAVGENEAGVSRNRMPVQELREIIGNMRALLGAYGSLAHGPVDPGRVRQFLLTMDDLTERGLECVDATEKRINNLERGVRWQKKGRKTKKAGS